MIIAVKFNGDAVNSGDTLTIWRQQSNLLQVNCIAADTTVRISTDGETWVGFVLDSTYHRAVIDLRPFVELGATAVYVRTSTADVKTFTISVAGLISPARLFVPWQHNCVGFCQEPEIVTPSVMLGDGGFLFVEFRNLGSGDLRVYQDGAQVSVVNGQCYIDTSSPIYIRKYTGETYTERRITDFETMCCDRRYARVMWVGATGVRKSAVFEAIKMKTRADGNVELQELSDGFGVIKGRIDGVTLRLEKLNTYDYWYFSDIVTSSEVIMNMVGSPVADYVKVTTGDYTLPELWETRDFEINVDFARYDAIK